MCFSDLPQSRPAVIVNEARARKRLSNTAPSSISVHFTRVQIHRLQGYHHTRLCACFAAIRLICTWHDRGWDVPVVATVADVLHVNNSHLMTFDFRPMLYSIKYTLLHMFRCAVASFVFRCIIFLTSLYISAAKRA